MIITRDGFIRSFQYVLEFVLLYLLVVPFYYSANVLPPILPYLCVMLIGTVPFIVVIRWKKNDISYLWFLSPFAVVIALSILVGFSLFVSFVLAVFVSWRMLAHYQQPDLNNEPQILGATFISGVILYVSLSMAHYFHTDWMIGIFILQFVLFSVGMYMKKVFRMPSIDLLENIKYVKVLVIGISAIGIVSALLMYLFPMIKWAIFEVLTLFTMGLALIFAPLFNYAVKIPLVGKTLQQSMNKKQLKPPVNEEYQFEALDNSGELMIWIVPTIAAIMIIIVAVVVYKKRMSLKRFASEASVVGVRSSDPVQVEKYKRIVRKKIMSPTEPIRKQVFELQRFAKKKGLGRLRTESAEEWLKRLHDDSSKAKRLANYYERVRYGTEELSLREVKSFHSDLKELKQIMIKKYDN